MEVTTKFLIQYDYPGTTNGKPVGRVYATGPHFGIDVWSHTYDPAEAATWPTREAAEDEASARYWDNWSAVEVTEAPHL